MFGDTRLSRLPDQANPWSCCLIVRLPQPSPRSTRTHVRCRMLTQVVISLSAPSSQYCLGRRMPCDAPYLMHSSHRLPALGHHLREKPFTVLSSSDLLSFLHATSYLLLGIGKLNLNHLFQMIKKASSQSLGEQ